LELMAQNILDLLGGMYKVRKSGGNFRYRFKHLLIIINWKSATINRLSPSGFESILFLKI
jgi:hypothetical protein